MKTLSSDAVRSLRATEVPGIERIEDLVAGKVRRPDPELIEAIDFAMGFLRSTGLPRDAKLIREAWDRTEPQVFLASTKPCWP